VDESTNLWQLGAKVVHQRGGATSTTATATTIMQRY